MSEHVSPYFWRVYVYSMSFCRVLEIDVVQADDPAAVIAVIKRHNPSVEAVRVQRADFPPLNVEDIEHAMRRRAQGSNPNYKHAIRYGKNRR